MVGRVPSPVIYISIAVWTVHIFYAAGSKGEQRKIANVLATLKYKQMLNVDGAAVD